MKLKPNEVLERLERLEQLERSAAVERLCKPKGTPVSSRGPRRPSGSGGVKKKGCSYHGAKHGKVCELRM